MTAFVAILMGGLSLYFADERAAYQAAHEFCPGTYVERVDDRSEFECEGVAYVARCEDGSCGIEPRTALSSAPPESSGS